MIQQWKQLSENSRILGLLAIGLIFLVSAYLINRSITHTYIDLSTGLSFQYPGQWKIEEQSIRELNFHTVNLRPRGVSSFRATAIPNILIVVRHSSSIEPDSITLLNKIMSEPLGQTNFEMLQEPTLIHHDKYELAKSIANIHSEGSAQLEVMVLSHNGQQVVVYAQKTYQQAYPDWDQAIDKIVESINLR